MRSDFKRGCPIFSSHLPKKRTKEIPLSDLPSTREAILDGRILNQGIPKRQRYTMKEKYDICEAAEDLINDTAYPEIRTPTDYFQMMHPSQEVAHKWIGLYGKWTKPDHRARMVQAILGNDFGSIGKTTRSAYHKMENLLYNDIIDKRKKGHRVSNTFIRLRALQLHNELERTGDPIYTERPFKASNGWRTNFIKRRSLKYKKRKSGKKHSADDHLEQFLIFLSRVRFKLLSPIQDAISDPLWGRFPPANRYNMDQVPLPFVVSQEFTFTLKTDNNVHITCPSEALRKRQWTMHVVVNAGVGEAKAGWVDLISKGKGVRIKKEEVTRYHQDVDMFWQKNAWVDTQVMIKLANKFVSFKKKKHGDDWIVLFCDNLSAHLAPEVKEIFGSNQVLLWFFPPNMTEMVQPIDAGYGRSLRAAIGRQLDNWLMNGENLLKWEGKMTAMERRILVTHLVARANSYMMEDARDEQRLSCFERTGCLMTVAEAELHDKKIRPQGLTKELKIPRELIGNNEVEIPRNNNEMTGEINNLIEEENENEESEILLNDEQNKDEELGLEYEI